MKNLLKLLRENSRLTNSELSAMLGISETEVAGEIARLEKEGIILGYTAIVNEEKLGEMLGESFVTALIEVKVSPKTELGYNEMAAKIAECPEVETAHLISGAYDISVTVKCRNVREVGLFVSERLAPLDGVLSVATHFVMERYKEKGVLFRPDADERELISP